MQARDALNFCRLLHRFIVALRCYASLTHHTSHFCEAALSGEIFYSALSSFEKPPSIPVSPVSKFGILNPVTRRINLRQN